MTEAIAEVTFDAPVKKAAKPAKKQAARKKPAKRAPPAPVAAPKVPFPGLTRSQCATACGAAGCTISCKPYCAHPTKGGLQAIDMGDPAALKRLQAARTQLSVKIDPDRFTGD